MTILSSLLNIKVDRYVYTESGTNELGESIKSWTLSGSNISCRMIPQESEERVETFGEYEINTFNAYFDPDITLDEEDRIKYNNKYYNVLEVFNDSSSEIKKAIVKEK